jgi:hypothetical protein
MIDDKCIVDYALRIPALCKVSLTYSPRHRKPRKGSNNPIMTVNLLHQHYFIHATVRYRRAVSFRYLGNTTLYPDEMSQK